MLARRFTIVCLLMTLFGMAFASLVAGTSHSGVSRSPRTGSCLFDLPCTAPLR